MYRITDAYESGSSSGNFRLFMGVVGSLLFTVILVLFLTINNSKMNSKLNQTVSDVKSLQNNKDASYNSLKVSGDSTLSGDVTAENNLEVSGSSNLNGDTTIGGDLQVGSKAAVQTALQVKGDTTFGDSASILGATKLNGALDVTGAAILQSGLEVGGDTSFGTDLTVTGIAKLVGALDVAGTGQLRSGLLVGGDSSFGDGIIVNGATSFGGSLDIVGVAKLQNGLGVGGDGSIDASVSGGQVGFSVQGSSSFGGDLGVLGVTLLGGNLSAGNADSTASFDGSVTNNGITSAFTGGAPTFSVQGSSSFGGDTYVIGVALLNGSLSAGTADNVATFDGTGVNANQTTLLGPGTPTFSVQGSTTLGGDITVNGIATIAGSLTGTGADSSTTFDGTGYNGTNSVLLGAGGPTFSVQGSTTLGGTDLTVVGISMLNGDLNVTNSDNAVLFDGSVNTATAALTIGGNLTSSGSAFDVTGSVQLAGSLNMTNADSEFSAASINVAGPTMVGGDILLTGNADLNNTLTVTGHATVDGDLSTTSFVSNGNSVGGNIYAQGIINSASHVSGQEFGIINGNSNYQRGSTALDSSSSQKVSGLNSTVADDVKACTATQHIRVLAVVGGLVTDTVCAADQVQTDPDPGYNYHYDLAENFPSSQQLKAGDVVSIDPTNAEHVIKTAGIHDDLAIGVVSTAPSITLGSAGPGYPVALSGRVPVKVTNEGGAIYSGDYLTSASMPGHAKKAAPGEKIIGQAMEPFSDAVGTVKMFVNVSSERTEARAIVQSAGSLTQGGSASLSSLNVSGLSVLKDLQVTGSATLANVVVVGQTKLADLQIDGHITGNDDTRGTVTIMKGQQIIHHDFLKPYIKSPIVVASPTESAVVYSVKATLTGFDIKIANPATDDTTFNYLVQE